MSQPNIVLLMTDQQRHDFTAAAGFPVDTMPFLDGLGRSGTRMRNAYTTAPVCVPARTSLLTGRFPSAHGVRQNHAQDQVVRGEDLLDVLSAAGYALHFAGKPHVYRRAESYDTYGGPYFHERGPDRTDTEREFSEWLRSIDHGPSLEPTPFPLEVQFPYRIVDDAITALDNRDDRPFFLWASMPEPHNPYQVPEPYFSMFPDIPERAVGPEGADLKGGDFAWLKGVVEEKRPGYDKLVDRYRANYCGMLRLIDDQLRRLVEHVRAIAPNTIFVFLSDHGDYTGEYGLQRKGAGLPEILVRVPFLISGPGIESGVERDEFMSLADLFPTLCELAGQPIPAGVQGRSLAPMLRGEEFPVAEFDSIYVEGGFGGLPYSVDERPELHFSYDGTKYDELNSVTQSGTTRMVRKGRWKLVYDVLGRGQIYDVEEDPMELDNRWDDPEVGGVRSQLLETLALWCLRVDDDLPVTKAYTLKRPPHNWYAG
ncbi:MAG TPA: sulfatase-like hydrolase/transferase [Mycobacteriales bacterium]|nr:sulfatase-like hydrolase/transferase [Mycobacteriales bacterium]